MSKSYLPPQCEFCGRFMSEDDIALGYHRYVYATKSEMEIQDVAYSHYECTQKRKVNIEAQGGSVDA